MKKLLTSLVISISAFGAQAGGPADGLYSCNTGGTFYYATVVSSTNGFGGLFPIALAQNNPMWGYMLGNFTNYTFVGVTGANTPFSLSILGNFTQLIGFINGLNTSCAKMFP